MSPATVLFYQHEVASHTQAYARGDSFAAKHQARKLGTFAKGNGSVLQQLYRPSSGVPGKEFSPIFNLTEDVITGRLHCEAKHRCAAVLKAVSNMSSISAAAHDDSGH